MTPPLLDDPNDWKRPVPPGRLPFYTWWTMGLGMGIAVLGINLLDLNGFLPVYLINNGGVALETHATLLWLVYGVGALWLAHWLLDENPGIGVRGAALQGLGSGFLAQSIYKFLQIIGIHGGQVLGRPLQTLWGLVLVAVFCALVSGSRVHVQRGGSWLPPLLALCVWLLLVKLGSFWH